MGISMNTQTFTTDELNEAIAEARNENICSMTIKEDGPVEIVRSPHLIRDYCGNIADAIPLLYEMAESDESTEPKLVVDKNWCAVMWWDKSNEKIGWNEAPPKMGALAISKAWYQHRFGVIVEVKEKAQ